MANAISTSFSHTFAGDEVLQIFTNKFAETSHGIEVTMHDNVKYKANLYKTTGMSDVLRRGNTAGFTTSGSLALTDITIYNRETKSEAAQDFTTFTSTAWSEALKDGVMRPELFGTPMAAVLVSEFVSKTVDNYISCDWFGVYASGVDIFGTYDGLFVDMLYNGHGSAITKTTISGYTSGSTLSADAVMDNILPKMFNNAARTLRQRKSDLVYLVTPTLYQNYQTSLRNLGTEMANMMVLNGRDTLSFDGIPIVQKLDWERDLANADNPLKTLLNVSGAHLALLTYKGNLHIATDFALGEASLSTWYNIDEEEIRLRTRSLRGTKVMWPEDISIAYFY